VSIASYSETSATQPISARRKNFKTKIMDQLRRIDPEGVRSKLLRNVSNTAHLRTAQKLQNKNHESINHRQNLKSPTLNDDNNDTATENLGIHQAVALWRKFWA